MKSFIFAFLFLIEFAKLLDAQNFTASIGQILTDVNNPTVFNVAVTNVTSGTTVNMDCRIVLWTKGFSFANINVTRLGNNVFSVGLSNYTVGRASDIQCGLGSGSNATVSLIVRPNIAALVCNNASVIIVPGRDNSTNVVATFTYALTSVANIICSSTNLISGRASSITGATTATINLSFNASANATETVNCEFSMAPVKNNFLINVNFDKAKIFFSPSSIVSSSPSITMNLLINFQTYQDLNLNCYVISNVTNFACPSIASYSNVAYWNVTSTVLFAANSTVTMNTISLYKFNSTPGVQDNFSVVCCSGQYIATGSVTLNYPSNDNMLQASTGETAYSYIQFYQLSQCPCDLIVGQCDTNCCCDSLCDCSSSNVIPISGPYGGYFNDTPQYSCQAPYQINTEPYHALLCVQFNTTNNLGYYYNTTSSVQTTDAFQSALNSVSRNSFQFTMTTQDISTGKILAYSANGAIPSFLSLPKQVVNSISCDLNTPVVFLQPYYSSCPYQVTSSNCQTITDPRLSYANYLLSSSAIANNCVNNISLQNINQNTPVYTFYNNGTSLWDDGYTFPSMPSISPSRTCDNVVLSVNYTLAYNSSGITYIRADVVLGNVQIDSVIYQSFSVSFLKTATTPTGLSSPNLLTVQDASNLQATSQVKVSGLYGYEDGMPVLLSNNSTMKTFAPSVSGVCQANSSGTSVLFFRDSFIQCQYSLTNSTCVNQRNESQTYLDNFFGNYSVAIYGNPQTSADYVNVVTFFNATTNLTIPSHNINTATSAYPIDSMTNFCENIVTGIAMTIYYSRQGKVRGQYIYNIKGVQKSYIVGNLTTFTPNGGNKNNQLTMTSTVEFVLLSANILGAQSTDNVAQAVCNFDICIDEILYPWLLPYEGKQGFYEQAFGVMLLGLAVFLLVTTYPWW